MKKIVLAGVVAAALISSNAMADVTTSATASWDAAQLKTPPARWSSLR